MRACFYSYVSLYFLLKAIVLDLKKEIWKGNDSQFCVNAVTQKLKNEVIVVLKVELVYLVLIIFIYVNIKKRHNNTQASNTIRAHALLLSVTAHNVKFR